MREKVLPQKVSKMCLKYMRVSNLFLSLCLLCSIITMETNFRICTYNCQGHKDDLISYIKNLLTKCHVVLIQEHWLFESQLAQFQNHFENAIVIGMSGMDESKLLTGRPYGGCAIVHNKTAQMSITPILHDDCNKRCQANLATIHCRNELVRMLIFNVYMPCDGEDSEAYSDVLSSIQSVLLSYDDVSYVIVGGDFNTDFSRTSSYHTMLLRNFCNEHSLIPCVETECSDVNFTYMSDINNALSVLDHFIVSESFVSSLMSYECIHDGDNVSDHCPVLMTSQLALLHTKVSDEIVSDKHIWKNACDEDIDNYKRHLSLRLGDIDIPREALACHNVACEKHTEAIDHYYDSIVQACVGASASSIPNRRKRKRKRLIGWGKKVQTLKQKSIFWTRLWRENGCPSVGHVNEIMIKAKREYKRVTRLIL